MRLLEEKSRNHEAWLLEDHPLGYSKSGDASESGGEPGDKNLLEMKGKDLGLP